MKYIDAGFSAGTVPFGKNASVIEKKEKKIKTLYFSAYLQIETICK